MFESASASNNFPIDTNQFILINEMSDTNSCDIIWCIRCYRSGSCEWNVSCHSSVVASVNIEISIEWYEWVRVWIACIGVRWSLCCRELFSFFVFWLLIFARIQRDLWKVNLPENLLSHLGFCLLFLFCFSIFLLLHKKFSKYEYLLEMKIHTLRENVAEQ